MHRYAKWVRAIAPALLLLGATQACTARRAMPAVAPSEPLSRADFSGITLKIAHFDVDGTSSADSTADVAALRASFIDFCRMNCGYDSVVDAEEPTTGLVLVANVTVSLAQTKHRTWILDAIAVYPMPVYFPLTPQWGDAITAVTLTMTDSTGQQLWTTTRTGEAGYSMIFYGWFRTGPEERAAAAATGQAFAAVVQDVAGANEKLRAAAEPTGNFPAVADSGSRAPEDAGGAGPAETTSGEQGPPPEGGSSPALAPAAAESKASALATPPSDDALAAAPGESDRFAKGLKIAVLPTQFDQTAAGKVPELFDDYLLSAVQNAGAFQVIGKSDIEALIGFEMQRDMAGCDDASCIADIGGALGVDMIVSIKIALFDDEWIATGKLVDIKAMRVKARTNEFVKGNVTALLKSVPNLVGKLLPKTGKPGA